MMRRVISYRVRGLRAWTASLDDRYTTADAARHLLPCTIILLVLASPGHGRYSGGNGTPEAPYRIASAQDLVTLAGEPDDWWSHFTLTDDLDMSEVSAGALQPIGDRTRPFSGVFDGADREIHRLQCLASGRDHVGLFGCIRGSIAEIRNVRLIDPNVQGDGHNIGALAGELQGGTIRDCRIEGGRVRGYIGVGGLVGWNQGTILDCRVDGEVTGDFSVGGLAGVNFWGTGIRRCRADVTVVGLNHVGGLVGGSALAEVHWCCATGRVDGRLKVGGLIGAAEGGITTNCRSLASVTGVEAVGGLVGSNGPSCDCSSGARPSEVACCYAAGPVLGEAEMGGLIGRNKDSIVETSFWDVETSGLSISDGGEPRATTEFHSPLPFLDAHWKTDFDPETRESWCLRTGSYPRGAWDCVDGDCDGDDDVDLRDFAFLADRWRSPDMSFWAGGTDLTHDGRTDLLDLQSMTGKWLRRR